jgi:hypothetical protein
MRNPIKPAVAISVIAVVILLAAVFYIRSSGGGKATKPEDLLKNEKIRSEIGKRFHEQSGQTDKQ